MTKGKRNQHEEELFQHFAPVVADLGYYLLDLRFSSESGKRFLRMYIDKAGGVNIDDCERTSEVCDALLEEQGEQSHDYFEVQSPGLDRPLDIPLGFQLHQHEMIEISLYQKLEGRKKFSALLLEADDHTIRIDLGEGEILTLSYDQIAQAKRVIQF